VRSRLALEELRRHLRSDHAEFTSRAGVVEHREPRFSPELLAFCMLAGMLPRT
jgi:hypothetical protein